ncbi:hypothetical protein H4S02_006827, partial [Coemansia sp. RSA 2611]
PPAAAAAAAVGRRARAGAGAAPAGYGCPPHGRRRRRHVPERHPPPARGCAGPGHAPAGSVLQHAVLDAARAALLGPFGSAAPAARPPFAPV